MIFRIRRYPFRRYPVRSRTLAAAVLLIAIAATPYAQQAPDPVQLPVQRVVLYKSGVGYFEHRGSITGSADVAIQFTSAQLNDVLKSMTAFDLDNGQISSIGFNSVAPIERRLEALRLPLGAKPDLLQFYNALRGARVEVRMGASSISGRLLGIERKVSGEKGTDQTDMLTVISNDGAVRTIVLGPNVAVRVAEQTLRDEIARYLSVVASGRDQDIRRMLLSATGEGTRRLLVSYVSEVPIWKSTYRLMLPDQPGEQSVLQGWAIVDNTVGEDWTGVELSLVAGAPQSFIQQVSQPYYARRPVVPLPQAVLLAPQTHDPALNVGRLSETITIAAERAGPAVDRVTAGGGRGGGVAGGVAGGIAAAPPPPVSQLRLAAETVAAATAQELGDLFEYRLTQPVTIRTNQSALVPILNAKVSAERVSLWNRAPGSGRPLRAVWLTNASGLTLDGGTFSVVDAGAFAGEGLVDPMKPGEKRLVSFGTDLAVMVDARLDESSGRYTRVTARDGVVIAQQEDRNRWMYRARNEDAAARTIVIEHPVRTEWKLGNDPAPIETTAAAARFKLPVDARGEATLAVTERRLGETRFAIDQMDDRVLATFGQRGVSVDALRKALQPVFEARAQLAEAERQLSALVAQVTTIANDQERVRENIKALGSSRGEERRESVPGDSARALLERYTRELNGQEDRLDELQIEVTKVSAERDARRAALAQLVQQLAFEVSVP
jgi:hypothetical protein